jgi:hypothetical protein
LQISKWVKKNLRAIQCKMLLSRKKLYFFVSLARIRHNSTAADRGGRSCVLS